MLRNRMYLGEINHRDKSYPGEHAPIIDPKLFEAVQTKLTENRQERRRGVKAPTLCSWASCSTIGATR